MPVSIGEIQGILKLRDDFSAALDKAAANVDRVGNRISRALDTPVAHSGKIVAGLSAGFVLLGKSIYDAATEAETTMAQLEAAVLSTGHVAGLSAKQISNMAGRLEDLTGAEDEAIVRAQTLLLTFQNVHRNAFEPATAAALNLAQRGFGPLDTTIKMVGKALNSPVKGLMALEKQLGKLDPAVKKSIQSLAEHGRIAEAQGLILDEIEKKVGGAAEAFRNTLPGAIAALRAEWGNLLEVVAETGGGGGMFRTAIEEMVRGLQWLQENWHLLESATFIVLGNISERVANFAAGVIGHFERIARVLQGFQNLIPDKFFLGLAGKTQKFTDSLVRGASAARKSVQQLGNDLKTGFEAKADDAASATEGLGESFSEGAYAAAELSEKTKRLAEELSNLRAELILTARHSREMLATLLSGIPGATIALAERQELEIAYLKDLEKFGKAAADGLQVLRLAASAAKRELAAFEELERLNEQMFKNATEDIKSQVHAGGLEMLEFTQRVFDASFVNWETFNDNVKAAIQARADERMELETEVWSFTATGFELAIANARAWHADFVRRIESAVERGIISTIQAEEKLAAARAELIEQEARIRTDALLGELGNVFDYLSDQFGGLFNYISRLISQVQQAQQFGQSVTGAASAAGMSAGAAGTLGTVVSVLGVWKAIYDIGMGILKENKSKKFGQAGGIAIEGGVTRLTTSGGVGQISSDAIRAVRDMVKAFEDALRISVDDLAEIGIKLRNDGKKVRAYVAGVLVGEFNDLMEAVQFAVARAVTTAGATFSGMSDLMAEGLKKIPRTNDLDEVIEFLSSLGEIGDLGLTDAIVALRDTTRHFDQLWSTLTKLKSASAAVQQGFDNLVQAEGRLWQQLFDSISGRQKSAAEIMADKVRELGLAKVELAIRKAQIAQRLVQIQADITAAKSSRVLIGGGGGGVGGGGVLGVAKAFSVAGQVVAQTAVTVVTAAVGISTAMVDALEAEQKALLELQKLLDGLIIPDEKDIRIPKTGGGGADDSGLRDFIKGKEFDLGLRVLSEYGRAQAEVIRQYEEQITQTGRDITSRAKLIELRERELALLAKEQKDTVANRFRDFLGLVTPFDQVRETAAALIKDIEESPFGNERKARMIGRVLEDVERQIEQLAQQAAVSLFGELIADLEKYGVDEQLLLAARQAMAVIEHTLKMEHYRTEIAILRAAGKLAPEALKALDDAIKLLEGVDPLKLFGLSALRPGLTRGYRDENGVFRPYIAGATGGETESADKLQDAIESATKSLIDMEREAFDPLTQDLLELQDKFKPIYEALGNTARVAQAHAAQTELIMRRHFGATMDLLDSLETSDMSPLRTIDKFEKAQADFFDSVADVLSGDFARLEDIPSLFEKAIGLAREVSPLGSEAYRKLFGDMKAALQQLAAMGGLPAGTLSQLASGMSVGNLLLPDAFNLSAQAQAQAMPVVDVIGKHSDRQVVILRSVESKLGSIDARTGELVAIGHSTNSVLRNVI